MCLFLVEEIFTQRDEWGKKRGIKWVDGYTKESKE